MSRRRSEVHIDVYDAIRSAYDNVGIPPPLAPPSDYDFVTLVLWPVFEDLLADGEFESLLMTGAGAQNRVAEYDFGWGYLSLIVIHQDLDDSLLFDRSRLIFRS